VDGQSDRVAHLQVTIDALHRANPVDGRESRAKDSMNCSSDEQTLRFEVDRYLGWPGQAPSSKVGEWIWLEARDEVRARTGAAFDLRQFHADALNLGPMGLDPLRRALATV
jgi:uncharacterized protein (DUF885 family)